MAELHPVLGHRDRRTALARALAHDTLPAALLLHGLPGVGKQRLALWIAQLRLCEAPDETQGPCGTCRECRQVLRLEHPDVHWYFPLPRPKGASSPEKLEDALEAARHAAIAEYREHTLHAAFSSEPAGLYVATARLIRKRAHKRPSTGTHQVFIIGSAEALVPQESSPEAANALLKLLEEPPDSAMFVLTSAEPYALLPTIRSRLSHIHLPPLSHDEVRGALTAWLDLPDAEAELATRLGQGSLGRSLGFLADDGGSPAPLEQIRQEALTLVKSTLTTAAEAPYAYAMRASPSKARALAPLFDQTAELLRDLAAVAGGFEDRIASVDQKKLFERITTAVGAPPDRYAEAIDAVYEARTLALGNNNPQLLLFQMMDRIRTVLRSKG